MSRVLTAVAGVPIVLLVTVWGPAWLFGGLVALCGMLALDEFLKLPPGVGAVGPGSWFLPLGAALTLSFLGSPVSILGTFVVSAGILFFTGLGHTSAAGARRRLTGALGGALYTCFLLGFLILLPRSGVLALLGIVWAGDTAAYYAGRAWGRHPLAPTVSPKKTIEGALAGAIGSVIVGMMVGWRTLGVPYGWMAAISFVAAVAAQAGDLFESRLKRKAGVKDSSDRLPGHGGFLDRIDSLLFAAPTFYVLWRFVV
jgi:phosphatidate cytidylyltransferase